MVSGSARNQAQLRDAGNPGDGYQHTPTDGGEQQRHSQREGAGEAEVADFDAPRILQNEDGEHHQEEERGGGRNPGGAGAG